MTPLADLGSAGNKLAPRQTGGVVRGQHIAMMLGVWPRLHSPTRVYLSRSAPWLTFLRK